jgi:hypothetical protein
VICLGRAADLARCEGDAVTLSRLRKDAGSSHCVPVRFKSHPASAKASGRGPRLADFAYLIWGTGSWNPSRPNQEIDAAVNAYRRHIEPTDRSAGLCAAEQLYQPVQVFLTLAGGLREGGEGLLGPGRVMVDETLPRGKRPAQLCEAFSAGKSYVPPQVSSGGTA